MQILLRCVRVFVASFLVLGLLGASPAMAQDGLGPDDPGFGPGFPGAITYPEEWDPALNPQLAVGLLDGFIEIVYDRSLGLAYDGFAEIVFDLETGDASDYRSGASLFPLDPLSLRDIRALFDYEVPEGAPVGVDPDDPILTDPDDPSGLDAADGADEDMPAGEPTTNAGAESDGDSEFIDPDELARQPHPMEDRDPILASYRDGTPVDQLGEFAIDAADLPAGALPEALQFYSYEIALLFELGAFDQATPWYDTFEQIGEDFAIEDAPRNELIATLRAVDDQFATRANLYGQAMTNDEIFVMWGVQNIPSGFYDDLAVGGFGFVNGFEYAAGLARLLASGAQSGVVATGATDIQLEAALARAIAALDIQSDLNRLLQLEIDELRAEVALLANPAISAIVPDVGGALNGGDDGDLVLYSAIAGLAGLLIIGALFFLIRQRRSGTNAPHPVRYDADAAMATNQLLAGARDEAEIVGILNRAAETQVGHATVLFHAVTDGLQPVGSKTILTGSDLNRVVTSGQRAMTVLRNDPAFPGETHAVMALPVIHGGKVQAVLASHRPGEQPFTDADLARLEPIAPALGGALETASELGTLTKLAMVDGLTSLGNRRRLDGDLETTIASAVAGDAPLGFAMIDVDHFKNFNDTHGHAAGDEVLRKVAAVIEQCVRESDVVYRYGGEEFSILFPGATPEEAAQVAERVRAAIEAEPFPGEDRQPGGSLTISVGVATLASGAPDDIRERADQALYRAKNDGRNRVAFA